MARRGDPGAETQEVSPQFADPPAFDTVGTFTYDAAGNLVVTYTDEG